MTGRDCSASSLRVALRGALTGPEIVVAPGAYDAISAKLIARHGFKAVYVTGAGTSNAHLGLPDVGLMTMAEMARLVEHIAGAVAVPVFSDADTGYGNELNVARTVRAFENAGAAGIHIEDQQSFKRCGHLDGKELVTIDDMVAKLRAAVDSRTDPNFVLIARTDAAAVEGIEGALERAHAYAAAGADVIFCEALKTRKEFGRFADEAPAVPLLANMTEFGKTPMISSGEFEQMGYAAVIFPMTAFRLMLRAIDDGMRELAEAGTQRDMLPRMLTREQLYEILEYDPQQPLPVQVTDLRGGEG
jgi:methylisocitrate lyase